MRIATVKKTSYKSEDWKDLYLAALFERNKGRIMSRIVEAQRAAAKRRAEILSEPGCDQSERQALDTVLFSLQALRSCLVVTGSAAA